MPVRQARFDAITLPQTDFAMDIEFPLSLQLPPTDLYSLDPTFAPAVDAPEDFGIEPELGSLLFCDLLKLALLSSQPPLNRRISS